tara:strand:- start:11778 stop:12428 length:651 start_codon:yes stop_codon:yes gene_type:complete
MILVLNNKDYNIPTSWKQIKLGDFMQFMQQIEGVEDETQQALITINTLTKAPIDLLEKCEKNKIDEVVETLQTLLNEEGNKELNLIFNIDGIDYGFHPNLHELKLKEFVDLDNKLSKGWLAMSDVMAILYRPITEQKGEKYKIQDYDFLTASKRAELFKDNLSISTVNGAASFFLTIATNYIQITRKSLQKMTRRQRRKILKQKKNNLTKNTVGTI